MNKIPNRKAICDVLLKEAETDKDIVVLCSDSRGSASLAPFAEAYPEQFVEMGIAEQDLVSVSAGFAHCGKKAFAASPACFLSARSYEQCKIDVVDGNSIEQLHAAFEEAKQTKGQPTVLIANTVKGKGSAVMEDKASWHHHVPSQEEYEQIMKDFEERKEQL